MVDGVICCGVPGVGGIVLGCGGPGGGGCAGAGDGVCSNDAVVTGVMEGYGEGVPVGVGDIDGEGGAKGAVWCIVCGGGVMGCVGWCVGFCGE